MAEDRTRLPYYPYLDFTEIEAKRRGLLWTRHIRADVPLGGLNATAVLESVTHSCTAR